MLQAYMAVLEFWSILDFFLPLGPEPAFGRLGLVNRWEGTVLRDTLLTPRFAPTLRAGAQLGGLASH